MDPARAPGYIDRRAAALSGAYLERRIELDNVRIEVCDWPGLGGPLVHVPEPASDSDLVSRLAGVLTPRWRILSIRPRLSQPYQVHVADLHAVCAQFGLRDVVVLAEGNSCTSAVLLAAWYPATVRGLVLVDATSLAAHDDLLARSLRDCPPDRAHIRQALTCRIVEASGSGTTLVQELQALLG